MCHLIINLKELFLGWPSWNEGRSIRLSNSEI